MSNITELQRQLNYETRRCKYAWAKYYEAIHTHLVADHTQYEYITRIETEETIPTHIKTQLKEMSKELKKKWECPICLDFIKEDELDITSCGHYYCKECLQGLKNATREPKWTCAVCRKKHSK
jgi:late competence protein required for DNA uptake (superfamily II DNA/RNA helicase)